MTAQRHLVLDAVCAAGPHAPIGRIIHHARQIDATVSLSTIYRTLALFSRLKLILVADGDYGEKQYEIALQEPHHHLRCRECGNEFTVEHGLLEPLLKEIGEAYQFAVGMDHLILYGQCQNCLEKNQSKAS